MWKSKKRRIEKLEEQNKSLWGYIKVFQDKIYELEGKSKVSLTPSECYDVKEIVKPN